jgi:hypothetical protein
MKSETARRTTITIRPSIEDKAKKLMAARSLPDNLSRLIEILVLREWERSGIAETVSSPPVRVRRPRPAGAPCPRKPTE